MGEKNNHREYSNGEITVTWEPAKCIHAKHCWQDLKTVFKPMKRPWVNMQGAKSEDIINQIEKCPSGALGYFRNEESKIMSEENKGQENVKLKVNLNGSLKVTGTVEIELPDGTVETKAGRFSLCRCGLSENKPFCDGAHKETGFDENWDMQNKPA